jgi:branched-chain amino acid transport system ATP-binding protein
MTVLENLQLGAGDHQDWEEELNAIHTLFPILNERESQLAGTLSGGERQMLAEGMVLMREPKLMMVDEPTAGLMPKLVNDVMNLINYSLPNGKKWHPPLKEKKS